MESDRTIAASHPPPAPPGPSNSLNGASNAFSRVRPMHGRTSGPTRRSTRGQWTPDEDEILCKAVQRFKGKNWKKIAECFKDRTDVQCLHRWQKVLNPELIKGPWSKEEDEIIVQLVNKYGPKKWSTIAQHLPGRIGKQCRERWHNHLNPAINKEAWTQEEELVLIRAHQMHGNRWAELTKYLPGRTDNAIKNHWNSSVKKKLDSYIASGLLAQFQNLPVISHQSQSMPAASMVVQQNSGDGNAYNDGVEVEQNSESSQIDCSQSASDMSNTAYRTTEDFLFEESDRRTLQSSSPTASCSEQYYTSVEDITFTIPNIPYEFNCSSGYLEDNYSRDPGDCAAGNSRFGVITLPNVSSVELGNDSSNLPGTYYLVDPRNDIVPEASHQSYEYEAPGSINNVAVNADAPEQRQNSREDCSELILQQEGGDGCPVNITNCSDIIDIDRFRDYISFQSIYQLSETSENVALQPNDVLDTLVEASDREHLSSGPSEFSVENGLVTGAKERSQINDSLAVTEAHDIADVGEGLAPAYINTGSPCQDPIAVGLTEQKEMEELSRLVPVNTFGSQSSDKQQSHSNVVERPPNVTCEQEAGTLCYQPPRFPSLDIPFFSCDLAHSCNDPQQDFSPLGIRQLMMSSMNSLTPFKLWDSPPSDDSPKAVLKSAAKSFACTPSILKKRHRDLLSPLSPFSERRLDKRTGSNVKQGILSTSRLTSEFSRLDVMFDEADDCKESTSPSIDQNNNALIEDKENVCPERQREEAKHNLAESGDRTSEGNNKNLKDFEKEDNLGQNTENPAGEDCASETPKGVLVERYLSDMQFSSPDGTRHKAGSAIDAGASEARSLNNIPEPAATSESMSSKAKFIVSPSLLSQKKQNNDPLFSGQSISAATSVMVDSLLNEVGAENLNIFGGTPFRRSIESPSAWKSPWYFSSLVNCPRFDSDLMVEDYGFFMSPGDRSVDAIGLMKQINEQGADAFADARAVLGSETPESILRQRCSKIRNLEGESSQRDSHIQLASDVLTERRVLDFSECETPAKSSDKGKGISAASLSSPSTCLLKSYR